jgi:hypothetical protein
MRFWIRTSNFVLLLSMDSSRGRLRALCHPRRRETRNGSKHKRPDRAGTNTGNENPFTRSYKLWNQGTDHLVSQSPTWWVHWQQNHKVWSSNPKPREAQIEDQKADKSSRRSSRRRNTAKANKRHEVWQSQAKWQSRAKKSSEEQERLKTKEKAQNQHSP